MRYYEDIEVGAARLSEGSRLVTAEEIKSFAGEYDPMPFHLDEEAAAASPMGGLCASSVHILSLGVQLSHTMGGDDEPMAILGGLGWDEVRFHTPLFAGDRVRVRSRIESLRESGSRPDRGVMTSLTEILRDDGSRVASFKIAVLIAKRPVNGS